MGMGIYDSFVDGHKEVQLKNFGKDLDVIRVGERTKVLEYGYPETCMFYCFVDPSEIVLIRDQIFIGIISREEAEKTGLTEIYCCDGQKFDLKDMLYHTLMRKI